MQDPARGSRYTPCAVAAARARVYETRVAGASTDAPQESGDTHVWWSPVRIDPGEARRWRIGPLSLTVARLRNEWRLGSTAGDDPLDTTLEVAAPATDDALAAAETVERFVTSGNTCRITLSPRLADRSVVVRPQIPLSVLPDDEARLFVSSPVFVAVVADGGERPLRELPTFRPSDTWFGSSTINGEVCYASRTACRLALDEVPFRPHRAVTAIRIRNRAGAPLLNLTRRRIKVPLLRRRRGVARDRVQDRPRGRRSVKIR